MMLRRLFTALLIALLVSAGCTLLLAHKLARPRSLTLRYVTASRDLDAGEVLKPGDLKIVNWPSNAVISGAITAPAEAAGRAVLSPLSSGQPILLKQLSALGGVGLSSKIPDGMRAISLKSDQVVGVAGFLLPGTHIDVLVTYRNPSQTDAVTATVLQDAEVIAAGQKTQPDPEGKASTVDVVTLLVSPHDAERVVLASSQGSVHFVLRNGADQQRIESQRTDIAALGLVQQPTVTHAITHKMLTRQVKSRTPEAAALTHGHPDSHEFHILVIRGDKQTVESF